MARRSLGDSIERLRERFWSKIDRTGECWVWSGCGWFSACGKAHVARDVAWFLEHGEWPSRGCHPTCGNSRCVRHLVAGPICLSGGIERKLSRVPNAEPHLARRDENPNYGVWRSIVRRCTNPKCHSWSRYGGRGITLCDEWRHDFEAFSRHVGPRPAGMQIDRIDNNRGYEPGNVRWATPAENVRNRRVTRFVVYNGKQVALAWLAARFNLKNSTLRSRVDAGWDLALALSKPERAHTRKAKEAP
jgi:hypothetical protein